MSASFRAQNLSNNENVCPASLRNKIIQKNNPPTKRIALSTINENARRSVVQKGPTKPLPKEVAIGFNNAYSLNIAHTSSNRPFTVYQESDQEESLSQNVLSLYKVDNENDVSLQEASDESSMALDTSLERPKLREDYFLCSLYSKSIYDYLRAQEKKFRPSPNYMRKQPDITLSMRSILVDWLVEVAEEYKMLTETLYLAVSYTDRFLSVMSVLRCKLQLVGTASMYIAAKYEEIYPPELREFVYITDDTYSKKQVLRMEHLILKVLSFDLSAPTAYTFLQHFCTMVNIPEETLHLAEYLCELTLLEAQPFLSYLPSEIAGASLCLANYTLGREPWSCELKDATGYSIEDIRECIENLFVTYSKAETYPQQAVREKYKSSKYGHVSEMPSPESIELPSC